MSNPYDPACFGRAAMARDEQPSVKIATQSEQHGIDPAASAQAAVAHLTSTPPPELAGKTHSEPTQPQDPAAFAGVALQWDETKPQRAPIEQPPDPATGPQDPARFGKATMIKRPPRGG